MPTPKERKDVYLQGAFTDAVSGAKPIKFKGFVLPEYFTCTVYLFDSDGKEVTKANVKRFKVWSVELLVRVTAPETLETITTTIKGASTYKGHVVVSMGVDEIKELAKLQKVKPSYYKAVADNRARLMGWVITSAVQSFIYKKQKDGTHYWPPFSRVKVSEADLQLLATGAIDNTYLKKDDAFYKEVARIYKQAVADGEWPNEVLKEKFPKEPAYSTKTVQGWTLECYERGLLSDKDKGKPTKVKKTPTKKKGK